MGETKEQIINLINEQEYVKIQDLFNNIDEYTIKEVIQSISENEILAIFGGCSDTAKEKIINSVHNIDLKETLIGKLNPTKSFEYIKYNKNTLPKELINNIIKELLRSTLDDLKKKILFEYKILPDVTNLELNQILGKKFVKENIKDIIKLELNENDTERKLELITQIEENVGDNIYINMDFNILNTQYIDAIGIDGIINIALNNEKQNELLNIDETRLKLLGRCLDNKSNITDIDTYRIILDKALTNISTDRFNNIIGEIDEITDLTDENIKTFQQIVQNNNIFEINSLNELRDYENVKKQKCDEWINSDNIEKKRLAGVLRERVMDRFTTTGIEFETSNIKYFMDEYLSRDIEQSMIRVNSKEPAPEHNGTYKISDTGKFSDEGITTYDKIGEMYQGYLTKEKEIEENENDK